MIVASIDDRPILFSDTVFSWTSTPIVGNCRSIVMIEPLTCAKPILISDTVFSLSFSLTSVDSPPYPANRCSVGLA